MPDSTPASPDDAAIRRRLARLQDGQADARQDAERLREESRKLADHYATVRHVTRAQWDARRAALNLLEDAEEARAAERRELAERRRADAALRTSEDKYRSLFESIDEGFCIVEVIFDADDRAVDYRFLDVNPAFARQTGLRDAVGKTALETGSPGDPFWFKMYGEVARTGVPVRFEHFSTGFGRWFTVYAFRTGEPARRQVAVVFDDITARKASEQRLADAQEQLRLIVESATEHAIVSLDLELRITSWNQGAERMFGYPAAEMLGEPLARIVTPGDIAAGLIEKEAREALAEGRAGGERWHPRRDGSLVWTNCVLMPMTPGPDGKPVGFVKIMRDETAALEARQALEQSRMFLEDALRDTEAARAVAEAASQAKDHFLAVLSHELRTPLTPVLMGVHLLSRNRALTGVARETLAMIGRNVQLEVSLIDDLLDLTRVGRGKLELLREECDLHETIRRAVEVVQPDIDGKAQRLTVALDAPDYRLNGDRTRLQQVCWNLLKNASKFTPEGGAVTIRSRAGATEGCVEVEVEDTGIGLEPEVAERIFHPFEQADGSITKLFGGLGLGLAISRAVVEGHGGELRVASPGRGHGATFTVSLPLG